jgi:murein DD-endopeptidase MepM/ murein hydrolase activator NlpD
VRRSHAIALCLAGTAGLLALAGQTIRTVAAPVVSPAEIAVAGQLTQGGWARGTAPPATVALMLDGKPVAMAPDRSFFLAFDRDAGPSATLTARFAGGRTQTRTLAIAPRAWKLEYIPIGPRPGTPPSEEFRRRRAAELVQIDAARAIDSGSQGWRQHFVWPVRGRISGLFGSQRIYNGTPGSYHSGTDVAGRTGTEFVAPADGVVVLAASSPFTLEGNLLMIDHGMGLNSAFLHCSQLLVREGEAVRQGQPIGRIGMTGRATGPHLHWSIKWRDARLDPMLFAGPMR